jgi:hypothetical protein
VSLGRISQLDKETLAKLQAGCNFINAEVSRLRNRVISVSILTFAGLGVWMVAMRHNPVWGDIRPALGVAVAIIALVAVHASRQLAKIYKSIVVRRVVAALGEGFTYSPESSFTKSHFLSMDLFNKRCEHWKSEDEVGGRKNQVSYSMHEAKATRTEGSGKNRRTVTIFRGLIVRLDFNKNFAGHTVVIPDSEGKILGGLFGESESRSRKEIVRLESADFENIFTVYSTNDQEARYLLTPKLMELVLQIRNVLGSEVRISFQENSVFLTIPQSKDRFEVALFGRPITPETAAGDLVEVVTLAEKLVDVLDLETRIWTRV